MQSIAPELCGHICKLIKSMNEHKGHSASVEESTFMGRFKCIFNITHLFHITSRVCNSPFHAVLNDVIESCGGSNEVITVLNRFGICSSVDTLNHIIHSVSLDRRTAGIKSLLDNALTVTSTDIVDFLQSNAAMYSSDQHCSWHATSIQLNQPMSDTAIHSEQSTARRRLFSTDREIVTALRIYVVLVGIHHQPCM